MAKPPPPIDGKPGLAEWLPLLGAIVQTLDSIAAEGRGDEDGESAGKGESEGNAAPADRGARDRSRD